MTASTTVGGIQQLDNDNLDMGTNDFTLEFDELLPTTRPTAAIVLDRKHDGANGYILSLLTTGVVRLQINGFTYDSTVALASATNVNPKLQVPVIRETATVAGSVTFYSNGVILGVAVAITAHGDLTTELVTNGTFDSDTAWTKGVGWTIAAGLASSDGTQSGTSGLEQTLTSVIGATYLATFEVTAIVAGTVAISGSGFTSPGSAVASTAGTFQRYLVATTTSMVFAANANADFVGSIDNVSVKRVATVNNASARIINGTTTTRVAGSLQASRLFNRALTAAEVLDLSINGPALADRGASQAAVITSNFSAGVSGFTGNAGTVTGNIDSIGGEDDWLRFVVDTALTGHFPRRSSSELTANTRFRISYKYYLPSGQSNVDGVRLHINNGATVVGAINTVTDTTTTVTEEFLVGSAVSDLRFYAYDGTSTTFQDAGGDDLFYIKSITVTKLGLTSELLASNAQSNTGQIFDTSGNKNHALLPASGATVVGRPVSQTREVRWTNTWAGTNELQYIGGVNQAILPANAYIESIVGTVSGATPHDIIVGDGSDTDRYVTITTGLAAGTTTFTLANRTTDGTNLKLTVDPDTNATMSIAWVISYKTLES
jgi:hypothetical protein